MNVLILGGTGMLGYATALEFLRRGHDVHAVSRRAARINEEVDRGVTQHVLNIEQATDAELTAVLTGMDVLVCALGPDDRVTPPAPALNGVHARNDPVGDVNLTGKELVGIIRTELGVPARVVNAPAFLTNLSFRAELRKTRAAGREAGLNPESLAGDLMYRELYPDVQESRRVPGYRSGGVQDAIRQTVRASYPALRRG